MWQPALFSVLGPSVCGGYEPGTGTGRMLIPVVAWRWKKFFSWFHIALPVGRVALFPCRLKHAKDEAASARAVTLHCRVEMTAPPGLPLLPPAPFCRASAAFLRGHRESFLLKRNEKKCRPLFLPHPLRTAVSAGVQHSRPGGNCKSASCRPIVESFNELSSHVEVQCRTHEKPH